MRGREGGGSSGAYSEIPADRFRFKLKSVRPEDPSFSLRLSSARDVIGLIVVLFLPKVRRWLGSGVVLREREGVLADSFFGSAVKKGSSLKIVMLPKKRLNIGRTQVRQ